MILFDAVVFEIFVEGCQFSILLEVVIELWSCSFLSSHIWF